MCEFREMKKKWKFAFPQKTLERYWDIKSRSTCYFHDQFLQSAYFPTTFSLSISLLFNNTIKRAASPLQALCSPRNQVRRTGKRTTKERGTGPKARGRGRNAMLQAVKERKALLKQQQEEKMNVCNYLSSL